MNPIDRKTFIKIYVCVLGLLLLGSTQAQEGEGGCPPGQSPYSSPNGVPTCGSMRDQAPPARWASRWGAIATDPKKGSLGTATNLSSKDQAEQVALADCQSKGGSTCKLDITYGNGCAAMVAGDTGYNTKAGATTNDAIQAAMKVCSAATSNCHAYYSACSPPVRIQ